MTPRERVLAALNHQQPDRVPIDFGGHRSSGIAAIAYAKLRKALGLPERPIRVYDPVQQLAIIDEDVLDRFGVDTIELGRGFALDDEHWADWTLPDGTPCQMPRLGPARSGEPGAWVLRSDERPRRSAEMPDGAIYFEQCYWPFLENDDLDRLPEALAENMWCARAQRRPGPLVAGPTATASAGRRGPAAPRQRPTGRSSACSAATCWRSGQFLYRIDNFLMLLAGNPERAHEFLDRLVEMHLANLERFLGAVGAVHRHHRLRRRPGHAERAADVAGHVPGVLQAAARADVAAGQGTGRREGHAPLLRRRAAAPARPDRGRAGRHQPRADLLHGMDARGLKADFGSHVPGKAPSGRRSRRGAGCPDHLA